MSLFTRRNVKDEIKDLLDRAYNLYTHNLNENDEGSQQTDLYFSMTIVKLKNLVEVYVKDEHT